MLIPTYEIVALMYLYIYNKYSFIFYVFGWVKIIQNFPDNSTFNYKYWLYLA
jgi:hypothetical protein